MSSTIFKRRVGNIYQNMFIWSIEIGLKRKIDFQNCFGMSSTIGLKLKIDFQNCFGMSSTIFNFFEVVAKYTKTFGKCQEKFSIFEKKEEGKVPPLFNICQALLFQSRFPLYERRYLDDVRASQGKIVQGVTCDFGRVTNDIFDKLGSFSAIITSFRN